MTFNKDSAKRDRSLLANALAKAGAANTHKKTICCPYHDDKHPSAEIRQSAAGYWNFACYVCDISYDVFEVRSRLENRSVADILREEFPEDAPPMAYIGSRRNVANGNGHSNGNGHTGPTSSQKPKDQKETFASYEEALKTLQERNPQIVIEEQNPYRDPETDDVDYWVIRYIPRPGEKKKFLPVHRGPDGLWRWEHPPAPWPLFNRKRVLAAASVLFVEGEKSVWKFVERMEFLESEITATTAPGGANNIKHADLSPLAGKTVFVFRDLDAPGEMWEKELTEKLLQIDPPCRIVRVRVEELGLTEKGDFVDLLEAFPGTTAQQTDLVQSILEAGEPIGGAAALREHFKQVREGKYINVHFPNMPTLSHQSKALLPGSIVCVCADPGAAKSLMMLEWFWLWAVDGKVKTHILMLEDDEKFHQRRALAQMSNDAKINDIDLHVAKPDHYDQILNVYENELETFARTLTVTNSKQMSLDEIANWIEERFVSGARVVGVDPITAATPAVNQWIADSTFVFRVKALCDKYQASVILTTHPRGTGGKPGLSGMANGMAFPRFSQCVLWLRNLDKPEDSPICGPGYSTLIRTHEQVLEIRKARSGPGQGRDMAVTFDRKTLRMVEIGMIEKN